MPVYGGGEFTLILLEASREDTEERAEVIRVEARRMHVEHAADAALYRAKAGGRDRVMVVTTAAPVAKASPGVASS